MSSELIKVTVDESGKQLVSARDLHDLLLVQEGKKERFSQWFKRYLQYGFEDGVDFVGCKKIYTANQHGAVGELDDYAMTIDMAKELAMLQKSDKGRAVRKYFLECEKKLKAQKPQLNKEQQAVLSIYELAGSDERVMEHVLVIKEANLRRGMAEGKRYLCDNRVITIPKIIDCIKKHYPEQFEGRSEIATVEWTRYLRQAGYLETRHFAKKNGRGMELRWAYQPTPMFYDVFVNQGMAISREIDERGKYEITYTSDVEKFILSDTFRKGFFDYIDMLYPKMETEQDVVV